MNKKVTDIVSYITLLGWAIAYFAGDRENSRFHLNQALVLNIAEIALGLLTKIFSRGLFGLVLDLVDVALFVLWVMGLVAACKGEERKLPVLGELQILP